MRAVACLHPEDHKAIVVVDQRMLATTMPWLALAGAKANAGGDPQAPQSIGKRCLKTPATPMARLMAMVEATTRLANTCMACWMSMSMVVTLRKNEEDDLPGAAWMNRIHSPPIAFTLAQCWLRAR